MPGTGRAPAVALLERVAGRARRLRRLAGPPGFPRMAARRPDAARRARRSGAAGLEPRSRPTVLDEATAHLDAATGDALAPEILAATDGQPALVVTHRPEQVAWLPVVEIGDACRCTPAGATTR